MRNGQSQWKPRRATGAIEPNWFKISKITQVMGVWEKHPHKTRQTPLDALSAVLWFSASPVHSLCLSDVLCQSFGDLYLSLAPRCQPQSLGVSQLGLSLLASSSPHHHSAESTILAKGFLSLEMPPFCLKLSKPCTHGISQEQSYSVSGEEGVLPFHFPLEALFLPLATGDSQTLALLRHTNHHADSYVHRSTIGWYVPSLGPLLIYLEADEATPLS